MNIIFIIIFHLYEKKIFGNAGAFLEATACKSKAPEKSKKTDAWTHTQIHTHAYTFTPINLHITYINISSNTKQGKRRHNTKNNKKGKGWRGNGRKRKGGSQAYLTHDSWSGHKMIIKMEPCQ